MSRYWPAPQPPPPEAELVLAGGAIFLCAVLYRARLLPRVLSAWGLVGYVIHLAGAVAELRPDLDEPEREVVVEMALGVAAWGVMAVGADQAWRDDVSGLVAALVRG